MSIPQPPPKIARGLFANLPQLQDGQLAFTEDTGQLWIGTASGSNVLLTKATTSLLPSSDVTTFGAKGDGVTDDTAAITAAVTAANAAGGGVVFFPKSTAGYIVSSTITIPSNVILQGTSRDNSVIKAKAPFTGTFVLSTTAINTGILDLQVHCNSIGNLSGISASSTGALQSSIARVKVIGLAKGAPYNNIGIYMKGFNAYLRDIEIDGGVIYGIELNGASDIFAQNLLCVNSDIGLALYGCEQVHLAHLQMDSCNSNYIVVDTSHNVSFDNVHCFFNTAAFTTTNNQVGILVGQGSTVYTASNLNSDIQFSNLTLRNFGQGTANDIGIQFYACENFSASNVSITNTSANYSTGGTIGVGVKYSQGSNTLSGLIGNLKITGVTTSSSGTAPASNWTIVSDQVATNTANIATNTSNISTNTSAIAAINAAKGAANGFASLDSSGLVPITQVPPAALERLVVVANQTARYALTTATVQNGDTVKQTDTGEMWYVVDQTNLGNSAGYSVYTAGTATSALSANTATSVTGSFSGDVTGTQSAMSVSKISGTTVSGTTGTGNVAFSVSPTFTGTAVFASATFSGTVKTGAGVLSGFGTNTLGYASGNTPSIQDSQTSGVAALMALVNDGTNNRRAQLFVDNTNSVWGLFNNYSAGGVIPFVISTANNEWMRISTAGAFTWGVSGGTQTHTVNGSFSSTGLITSTRSNFAKINLTNTVTGASTWTLENGGGTFDINNGGTLFFQISSSGAATFSSTVTQNGSTSGAVTLQTQAAAGTYNWNWPTTAGSAGQVLTSQGGGSSAMTWTQFSTTPTASVISQWDANKNLSANNMIDGYATTATAAGTTTLTVSSAGIQNFTGTTTQTVALPVATTLVNGQTWIIQNQSTGALTVQTSGGNTLVTVAANQTATVTCVNTAGGTGTASWTYNLAAQSVGGSGTVTSVTFTGDGTVLSSTPSTAVTSSGTVTASLNAQAANTALMGPTSGSNANPTFRKIVAADIPAQYAARNFLLNADAGLWQRGTSTTTANSGTAYQADRFYMTNSLGAAGILTYAQVAATNAQSMYGMKVTVSTAPTAGVAYGINLAQSLDNATSRRLYNQTASLSMQIKAQGNVNQVTIAIGYVTSEAKHGITSGLPTTLISSQTVAVNSTGFTLGQLLNVAMGTAVTTAGSYFIVVYASGVSTGNVSDLGNGFIVEQPMLNLGPNAASFSTAGANAGDELTMCQRFYESSFPVNTAPATQAATLETATATYWSTSAAITQAARFKVTKRATPTLTFYDPGSATASAVSYINLSGSSVTGYNSAAGLTVYQSMVNQFSLNMTGLATGTVGYSILVKMNWTADAEI
jgi:hypothetical protein